MHTNYKYGYRLANYTGFDRECMEKAVPFPIQEYSNIDQQIPFPTNRDNSFSISRFGKHMKKTEHGDIYALSESRYDKMIHAISKHTEAIIGSHEFKPIILNNKDLQVSRYIVKVCTTPSKRFVYTCMKELLMTNDVYTSSYDNIIGSSITCKPFFGCMIWTGKNWKYLIVFERANGVTLPKATSLLNKLLNCRYDKNKIMHTLTMTAKNLWLLGFAHNDLRGDNVIYDIKTNTVKIIDFETAVRLPDNYIQDLRGKVAKVQEDGYRYNFEGLSCIFESCYKQIAVSLLALSEQVCLSYADEDGLIFNTDDFFLPLSFQIV
jgi:hypothetical protein